MTYAFLASGARCAKPGRLRDGTHFPITYRPSFPAPAAPQIRAWFGGWFTAPATLLDVVHADGVLAATFLSSLDCRTSRNIFAIRFTRARTGILFVDWRMTLYSRKPDLLCGWVLD